MNTFGVRELRQNASEILRSVEAGESATVTVAGRPVAQIVPIHTARWTSWDRVASVFDSPTDLNWRIDRASEAPDGLIDPWSR